MVDCLKLLLISGSEKSAESLSALLKEVRIASVLTVKSGGEARRILLDNDFDIILINTPLTDEFGNELAAALTETTASSVIMLVRHDIADGVAQKMERFGVLVIEKPVGKIILHQTIRLAAAARNRLLGIKQDNIRLQQKIEEIRLVDRAKCVLIQYLNMTEEQAHKYIEKQAMNTRMTRKDIAVSILKSYEI